MIHINIFLIIYYRKIGFNTVFVFSGSHLDHSGVATGPEPPRGFPCRPFCLRRSSSPQRARSCTFCGIAARFSLDSPQLVYHIIFIKLCQFDGRRSGRTIFQILSRFLFDFRSDCQFSLYFPIFRSLLASANFSPLLRRSLGSPGFPPSSCGQHTGPNHPENRNGSSLPG